VVECLEFDVDSSEFKEEVLKGEYVRERLIGIKNL